MSAPLRIIFAGTPEFAIPALQGLLDCGQHIVAVLTQPDRPSGRGRKIELNPVKLLAVSHNLPVLQPETLKDTAIQAHLATLQADLLVKAAYGLLLPSNVLALPRLGCINVHASLLPRWRGAAPIQRAILAGDQETGITIMQMTAGLDAGPIIAQYACPILAEDTAATVHDRLAILGGQALVATLPLITSGNMSPQAQDPAMVTIAPKIAKAEALITWTNPAATLARQVRAFNPWPVAETNYLGTTLRIWAATAVAGRGEPGMVINCSAAGIDVGTGTELLRITRLQLPGKRIVAASDFINAHDLREGIFG